MQVMPLRLLQGQLRQGRSQLPRDQRAVGPQLWQRLHLLQRPVHRGAAGALKGGEVGREVVRRGIGQLEEDLSTHLKKDLLNILIKVILRVFLRCSQVIFP